jgi:predicted nuclease of restriction endonuclease-like RecB superfamily
MSLSDSSGRGTQEARRKVWEEFTNDQVMLSIMRITPDELARLHNVFLISGIREKQDLFNALNRIRRRGF